MDLDVTFTEPPVSALSPLLADRRADLHRVMFAAIASVLQSHFEALDTQRHRSSVTPGFYARASQNIQPVDLGPDTFTVAINQPGLAQRYYGGTINASNAKFFTIPASPVSLGRRAGEFTNLKCIFFRGLDLGALVDASPRGTIPDEQGRRPVVFWLKRSVTQPPDPGVLPTAGALQTAAYTAAASFLQDAPATAANP